MIEAQIAYCNINPFFFSSSRLHGSGLACRTLNATKILITGKNRLRISGVSMLDALQPDGKSITQHQVSSPDDHYIFSFLFVKNNHNNAHYLVA